MFVIYTKEDNIYLHLLNFEVTCNKFCNSEDIVEFLSNKFKDNQEPVYYFKDIDEERLMADREKSKMRKVCTINWSSNFQVMVYRPNNDIIRASNGYASAINAKLSMVCVTTSMITRC